MLSILGQAFPQGHLYVHSPKAVELRLDGWTLYFSEPRVEIVNQVVGESFMGGAFTFDRDLVGFLSFAVSKYCLPDRGPDVSLPCLGDLHLTQELVWKHLKDDQGALMVQDKEARFKLRVEPGTNRLTLTDYVGRMAGPTQWEIVFARPVQQYQAPLGLVTSGLKMEKSELVRHLEYLAELALG